MGDSRRIRQSHTLWRATRRDQGLPKFALTCRRRPDGKSRRFLRGLEKNREWYAGNRNVPAALVRPVFAIKYRQRAAPRFFDVPKMPVKRFAARVYFPRYRSLWGWLDRQEGRFRPISRISRTRENTGSLCCKWPANQLTLPRLKISRFARSSPPFKSRSFINTAGVETDESLQA